MTLKRPLLGSSVLVVFLLALKALLGRSTLASVAKVAVQLCAGFAVFLLLVVVGVLLTSRPPWTRPRKPWQAARHLIDDFAWDKTRPLKITFLTWGSRGDHQPNIALGLELARRGHEVTVLCLEKYRHLIERHTSIKPAVCEDSFLWGMADAMNKPGNEAKSIQICGRYVSDSAEELVSQYVELGRDADVLIGQCIPFCCLAQFTAAEVLRKPLFFTVHDALTTMPTAAYSFDPGVNRISDFGWLRNTLNTRVMPMALGVLTTLSPFSKVRRLRARLGLTTRYPVMEVLGPRLLASIPTFYTWDTSLWPHPGDFSPHWIPTGYFVTKGATEPADPEGLKAWIAEQEGTGRQFIFLSAGSFGHIDKRLYTELLLDAMKKLNIGAVISATTVDLDVEGARRPDLKVVGDADYEWLFPRCLVVVHHGGAGTSHSCIRSGRPGVCVPSMHFQELWGAKLQEFGAGALVTQEELRRGWNAGKNALLAALQAALQPSVAAKATAIAGESRRAPGVELAADKLEEYLRQIA